MDRKRQQSGEAARELILSAFHDRQRQNPQLSLRAWSKRLGYRNPSFLSDVLSGRRCLTPPFASRLACSLGLDDDKIREIHALVTGPDVPAKKSSSRVRVASAAKLDEFRLISEWYHLAILELLQLRGVVSTCEGLGRRLINVVPLPLVATALGRLKRLGFVMELPGGRFARSRKASHFFVDSSNGDLAIRKFHAAMLENAATALNEQDVATRYFSGTALAVRARDLATVRKKIAELHAFVSSLEPAQGAGDLVYFLGTQFFRLDRAEAEITRGDHGNVDVEKT